MTNQPDWEKDFDEKFTYKRPIGYDELKPHPTNKSAMYQTMQFGRAMYGKDEYSTKLLKDWIRSTIQAERLEAARSIADAANEAGIVPRHELTDPESWKKALAKFIQAEKEALLDEIIDEAKDISENWVTMDLIRKVKSELGDKK